MGKFFDYFPKTGYNVSGLTPSKIDGVTNIFFRTRILRSVLRNAAAYYEHTVQDGETPEILADRAYGDPEAHWIILYANDVVDPQYDWPLNYKNFNNHIVKKYGSIANAKTQIHHHEMVIERTESFSGTVTETRYLVNEEPESNVFYRAAKTAELVLSNANGIFTIGSTANVGTSFIGIVDKFEASNGYIKLANTQGQFFREQRLDSGESNGTISLVLNLPPRLLADPSIKFDYYDGLASDGYFQAFNMGYETKIKSNTLFNSGRTVFQRTYRNAVSYYEWEVAENDRKRLIKVIKPEYYGQIIEEFNNLTRFSNAPFIRRFV